MSARPCPTILGDCIGGDSPIIGLSSLAEDTVLFYASCAPASDAFAPPPLGGGIVTPSCVYTVFVGESQAEADAAAAAACGPQLPALPTIYYNNPQTAQVTCPTPDYLTDDQGNRITDDQGNRIILGYSEAGGIASATVPYGAFASTDSQADADAEAMAVATQLANDKAADHNCDPAPIGNVLTGFGGDPLIGFGGEPVEPVSW